MLKCHIYNDTIQHLLSFTPRLLVYSLRPCLGAPRLSTRAFREEAHPEFGPGPVFKKTTENKPRACFGVYNSDNNYLKRGLPQISWSFHVILYNSKTKSSHLYNL